MPSRRDVTATVESIPLIVSSILAKKLAEGLDGLVLDVKTGNGAFMREREASRNLANNLCMTATQAGLHCNALITDMNQPLGWTVGNALELNEAIDFLTGECRNPRLEEVTMGLASELLLLGGLAADEKEARRRLQRALDLVADSQPGMRVRLGGARSWLHWIADGPKPRLRLVSGSDWDGNNPEGAPFLDEPLDPVHGPVAEVLVEQYPSQAQFSHLIPPLRTVARTVARLHPARQRKEPPVPVAGLLRPRVQQALQQSR